MSEENILQTPVHHNTECHDRDWHKSKLSKMHQVRKGESEVKPQWMIYQKYVDLKEEGANIIILDTCGYSCRVLVSSKIFIVLKPLIHTKNKMVDIFYHLSKR